jgi:hypothetical protein
MTPERRLAEPSPPQRLRELAQRVRRLSIVGRLDIEASYVERESVVIELRRLAREMERAA